MSVKINSAESEEQVEGLVIVLRRKKHSFPYSFVFSSFLTISIAHKRKRNVTENQLNIQLIKSDIIFSFFYGIL